MENTKNTTMSRRGFLKKAAYTAPAVITIGALTLPATAGASTFIHNSLSATSGKVTSTATIVTKNGTNIVQEGSYVNVPDFPTNSAYTISGSEVKTQANAQNETWSWTNNIFGGTNWIGQP